jgi:hypothetical protein
MRVLRVFDRLEHVALAVEDDDRLRWVGPYGHRPAHPEGSAETVRCTIPRFMFADNWTAPGHSAALRAWRTKRKPPDLIEIRGLLDFVPAATYSPRASAQVPSALKSLTTEFGMGSGVSSSLRPPGTLHSGANVRLNSSIDEVNSVGDSKRTRTHMHICNV